MELILQVAIPLADTKAEEADLEIRFGTGPYAGVEQMRVLSDEVTPVCSPDYLHEAGPFGAFDTLADVARARLIRSPLDPWSTWFNAHGLALAEPQVGVQFNDVGLVLDAAAAGFGVALMRMKLGAGVPTFDGHPGDPPRAALAAPPLPVLEAGRDGALGVRRLRRLAQERPGLTPV